jgi:regulator of sigma E protease
MEFLIKASQLILSLSILVVLHELGHFIPAKLFKTRVEKFYLFFNPWFSIFKRKIGETEWGIGWLPLGGYVKIAGMVDESMDTEQLAKPAEPWEFRSKPAWQRLIIMLGGVIVNFLLALFIYAMVLWAYGKEYATPETAKYGMVVADPKLKKFGLQDGDIPLKVDDIKLKTINDAMRVVLIDGKRELTVLRKGEEVKIQLPKNFDQIALKNKYQSLYSAMRIPTVVSSFSKDSNAKKAGLKEGDSITGINGKAVFYFDDVQRTIFKNKNKSVELAIVRNNKEKALKVKVNEKGFIGFEPQGYEYHNFKFATEKFTFLESFPAGTQAGMDMLSNYVKSLSLVFTKEGAQQVGGFGSMGKIFPSEWDWRIFWLNTAMISIILAFMNILPIPALDGGHVVFLLYEIVTGREAPQKVLEYAQYVGFFLLIGLMLYANGNDIYRALTGG